MILSPRYEGATILSVAGPVDDQELPCTRQRRRFEALLAGLTDDQWDAPSRCAGWSVRDVVVHVTSVNAFWQFSVQMGLAGTPTQLLGTFDPVATPASMVAATEPVPTAEVLAAFVASNDGFLGAIAGLADEAWLTPAEAPIGHVPIHLVVQHALWDSWVHERDVALPLGLSPAIEPDEVRSCLVYAAAVSPALGFGVGSAFRGSLSVEATDPDCAFTIDVDDSVAVSSAASAGSNAACLRGPAVELAEALSLRAPLPADAPLEWHQLLAGLATAFDAT
jgi:uncharacterized protein (TIGR03083 family)